MIMHPVLAASEGVMVIFKGNPCDWRLGLGKEVASSGWSGETSV